MPYIVEKDEDACSASKPWAVKVKDSGKVMGCHASEADAQSQQRALYANEADAAAQGAALERRHMMHVVSRPVSVASMPVPVVEDAGVVSETGIHLVTVRNVPLMCVGMEFPASTGPVTFDFGDVSSAVIAGADPTIPRSRIKLGHTDPRYNDFPCPHCGEWIEFNANDSYIFDGDPNFGFVQSPRLENDGAWIYADLADVPKWLADVMPVAFPSRSIEGWFGYKGINDKEYKFIITALSLLGVVFPGVMNLADLPSMYGDTQPEFVDFVEVAA